MAQANDTSAPRKTKTYKSFSGMNSQDGRYGCEDDDFFFLENIMRVADGKLHSVPGPTAALVTFPIIPPVVSGFLLLESGDFVLLEDGGKIITNG